jgi:hypothetical protein
MPEEPEGDLLARSRRTVEAFARGAFDESAAMFSERGVLDLSPMGLGVFEGREAILGLIGDWFEPYAEYKVELEENSDLGNGVIFNVILYVARPAGSSRWVDVRHSYVLTWTDGFIERNTGYDDIDEGRDAAERLAEERRSAVP